MRSPAGRGDRRTRARAPAGAFAVAGVIATLAAGCAIGPLGGTPAPPRVADAACVRLFEAIDAEVARAGTGDGGTARVEGFRTLRVDRLLASYAGEPMDAGRFGDWVGAMRSLDRNARAVEIANLPQERRARVRALVDALPADVADPDAGDAGRIDACAERVLALDLEVPGARAFILSAASVPDDYDDRLRALGLYPFTAFGYAAGIRVYERETRAAWSLPLADLPRRGVSKIYRPVGAAVDVAELRRTVGALVASDAFPPAPRADPAAVERLFAAYAPAWVIDEATPADRPGHVVLRADGRPDVDPASVVVTTRLAWTRFDRTLLPQLVYTIWFPDRPSQFPGDPLAGRLDGLVWRVTLDRDGAPLVFDTIHACGCYHQFIPTGRLVEKPAAGSVEESALVVQTLPPLTAGPRATLVVASGTHYLRRVLIGEDPAEDLRSAASSSAVITYTLAADGDLRSLRDNGGGTRSLFRPDGLVGGSERPERALFWPTGIVSAGAMRQWGRHATAFVGRRHFDEPFLIERYFSRADR